MSLNSTDSEVGITLAHAFSVEGGGLPPCTRLLSRGMKKLKVAVLFGGRSGEHEVSLLSAASVLAAINRNRYEVIPVGITKTGRWLLADESEAMLLGSPADGSAEKSQSSDLDRQDHAGETDEAAAGAMARKQVGTALPAFSAAMGGVEQWLSFDVVLPVLHGTFGEDGTIQGLLELAGIPYAGSGVLGSAAGMDKDVMKRLFAAAGLPIPKHVSLLRSSWQQDPKGARKKIEAALQYPVFVKPANGGSSVGISKAHDRGELAVSLDLAARYDRKLVVEQAIGSGRKGTGKARELEVAILGNDAPEASVVGEIVPAKEFYDYEAKYLSQGSELVLPAKLTKKQAKVIREMAILAFQACDCAGLARVDFLMEAGTDGGIYLNEINTLPGFTAISMYPKLWEASGVPYPELIDRLITLALERAKDRSATSFDFATASEGAVPSAGTSARSKVSKQKSRTGDKAQL